MPETVDVREAAAILSSTGLLVRRMFSHRDDMYYFIDDKGNYTSLREKNEIVVLCFDIPKSGGAVETVDFLTGLVRLVGPIQALVLLTDSNKHD